VTLTVDFGALPLTNVIVAVSTRTNKHHSC
jgi:hypothetical protein